MVVNGNYYNINKISFNGKQKTFSKRNYSDVERSLRHTINTLAINNGIKDIYTGKPLKPKSNPSSVEHLIAFSQKNQANLPPNFNINGLANWFPVGLKGNMERSNKDFKSIVRKDPVVLDRMLHEMGKIEKINSNTIDCKDWMNQVRNTLSSILEGICSDVVTHKIKFVNK